MGKPLITADGGTSQTSAGGYAGGGGNMAG